MLVTIFKILCLILVSQLIAASSYGQEYDVSSHLAQDRLLTSPFKRSYLNLEFSRNFPLSTSQNYFLPGPIQPILSYRHNLSHGWLLGLGGQVKILRNSKPTTNRETAFWSTFHETFRVIRLHHPNYLLIGPKLSYLVPATNGKLPLRRDATLQVEFGVGLSIILAHYFDDKFITLRFDRWRGVTTNRLHGIEIALGINIPINTSSQQAHISE